MQGSPFLEHPAFYSRGHQWEIFTSTYSQRLTRAEDNSLFLPFAKARKIGSNNW